MDWTVVVPVFFQMILECIKRRDDREAVAARLLNPGAAETWAIRRGLRKTTELHGRELTAATREAFGTLYEMDESEINELIEEAEEEAA